jgi:hypothetical protein
VSPKRSSVISDTFVRSEGICFTPGFPVKGPKFGALSSFTHVVASAFEVLSLSSELVSLSLYFFSQQNFCFSHKVATFTEKYPQEHQINCLSIILEESNLPCYVFLLSNNSLLAKRYETLAACQTPD